MSIKNKLRIIAGSLVIIGAILSMTLKTVIGAWLIMAAGLVFFSLLFIRRID